MSKKNKRKVPEGTITTRTPESTKRKKLRNLIILFSIMTVVMGAGLIWFLSMDGITAPNIVYIAVILTMLVTDIILILTYVVRYVGSARTDEDPTTDRDARRRDVYSRKDAKDMYDIFRWYKRRFNKNNILLYIALIFVVVGICILMPEQYDIKIPWWVLSIGAVAILAISFIIGGRSDLAFKSIDDMRKTIQNSGFDEVHVNNDIMSGTYHYLFKGLLVIGRNYYVIYAQKLCYIGAVDRIVHVEGFSRLYKIQNGNITHHYVNIREQGISHRLTCADEAAQELILYEFTKLGIDVTDLSAVS